MITLAKYRCGSLTGSFAYLDTELGAVMEKVSGYVRISEFVDVEFPLIDPNEARLAEIASLEKLRSAEAQRADQKLSDLDARLNELKSVEAV